LRVWNGGMCLGEGSFGTMWDVEMQECFLLYGHW
jgi:hypothetical protein